MSPPRIKVTVLGVDALKRNIDNFNDHTKARVKQVINKHALNLMNEAKRECPVDMGQLRASIQPSFFNQGGLTAEVSTNVGYGAFVEFGTGPLGRSTYRGELPADYVHGPGGKMPPLEPIREWCRRHHINPNLAFVIARKIGRHGMKARPFMWPALEKVRPEYERELRDLFNNGGGFTPSGGPSVPSSPLPSGGSSMPKSPSPRLRDSKGRFI